VKRTAVTIAGCELEIHEGGSGAPLLFLHPGGGFNPEDPYVELLTATHRVIAPSHPGFGGSQLPDWIDHVDDIAHIYLELMDKMGLAKVDVIACSVGGWIAAEMMTKTPERFGKVVLVGPVGVKTGPTDKLDIPDIYVMPPADVPKLMYHDPVKNAVQPAMLSDEELAISARNRETLALLVWEPYMHNPKLRRRLHRITAPTLFVWGEKDGIVTPDYGRAYAAGVSGAKFELIADAGHLPHIEQTEAFFAAVNPFLA